MVPLEEARPGGVAELAHAIGRADDVGEEDRGKHPVGERSGPDAGEELLDRVEIWSASTNGTWTSPASSMNRAPGMCSAM